MVVGWVSLIFTVLALAYLHRLAERDFPYVTVDASLSAEYFWNSLWFVFCTGSTVGYIYV